MSLMKTTGKIKSIKNTPYCVMEVMEKGVLSSLAIPESLILGDEYLWPISNIQKSRMEAFTPRDNWKRFKIKRILFKNISRCIYLKI